MAILSDYHMHSSYSFDSEEPMQKMIEAAISKGFKSICFTEHMDIGAPITKEWPDHAWEVNVDSYLYNLLMLKDKCADKLEVNFGIELGLTLDSFRPNAVCAKSHEFDFIIGSIHFVDGLDLYWPEYYEGRSAKESVLAYFKAVRDNVRQFNNFDVVGHMDYVARNLPEGEKAYVPGDYTDITDEILEILIEKEKGIELNTAQIKKGFSQGNPCMEILKRYKELGGEIITIGSDAHEAIHVGSDFDKAEAFLREAGFNYYTTFSGRSPSFQKL